MIVLSHCTQNKRPYDLNNCLDAVFGIGIMPLCTVIFYKTKKFYVKRSV